MWESADIEAINARIKAKILAHAPQSGKHPCAVPGLYLSRREATNELRVFYSPFIGLTVQGGKRTLVGAEEYCYGEYHCFVAGVDMPSESTIIAASPEVPFLALALDLNRELVAELLAAAPPESGRAAAGVPRGVAVMRVDRKVLLAFLRLVSLLDEPEDIPLMAPLLTREIHHRLLFGPQGGWLRAICAGGAAGNQVARAVSRIRAEYKSPLSVPDLAKSVGMSESSFFRGFKQVTTMTPLQFQKTLRLYEAQRLLLMRESNVENTAYAVGYESAPQFIREYKRMFGQPPRRHNAPGRADRAAA